MLKFILPIILILFQSQTPAQTLTTSISTTSSISTKYLKDIYKSCYYNSVAPPDWTRYVCTEKQLQTSSGISYSYNCKSNRVITTQDISKTTGLFTNIPISNRNICIAKFVNDTNNALFLDFGFELTKFSPGECLIRSVNFLSNVQLNAESQFIRTQDILTSSVKCILTQP